MASLPPQQQSQRRASPPQRQQSQDETQSSARRANSQAPSTTSVDSQTVFLNEPPTTASEDQATSAGKSTGAQQSAQPIEDPRKCWICFQDETEDTPESSAWRTPCPCALTAHESCLLDWVADMEAPTSSRSTAAPADIRCPQCKSEIFLARPRSRIVEAVGAFEKLSGRMLLPAVMGGLTYTIALVASHHGAHTIRMIFSERDAEAILAPVRPGLIEQRLLETVPSLAQPFFRDWRGLRIELGLPLIPMALIASRTTLADAVLPILPIVFFATHPESSQTLHVGYWPPSAALTLVILPYLRSIYDEYLERVWGPHERKWLKEIRPRLGNEDEEGAEDLDQDIVQHNHHHHHRDEEVVEIEVGIELDVFGDGNDDDEDAAADRAPQQQQAPPLNAQPADIDVGDQAQAAAGQQQPPNAGQNQDAPPQNNGAGQQQRQRQAGGRNNDILISGTRLATTVAGALFFPTLSACAGELLQLLLPMSWTVPLTVGNRYSRRTLPTGILQTRWGRSIVGGCLLVVLKDAVRIYCRWKMAKAHRQRRVLDWDKEKGKVVE